MTRYLISFDDGAMTFPEEELPDVAEAAHKVVYEAKDAGVWIFGGGLLRACCKTVGPRSRPARRNIAALPMEGRVEQD